MFIVFDMDGTLSDPSHRVHHLEGDEPNWDAFFEACDGDAQFRHVVQLMMTLRDAGHNIAIWTGRTEKVRAKTVAWLKKYTGNDDYYLVMREDGDHRHDLEVKGEWLEEYGEPDIIFDDRNSMVDFWRSRGITCCQTAKGDF